jgi:hypothetical protein
MLWGTEPSSCSILVSRFLSCSSALTMPTLEPETLLPEPEASESLSGRLSSDGKYIRVRSERTDEQDEDLELQDHD